MMGNSSRLRDFAYCLASSLLLVFAFPKTHLWFLAWVGLIPLMFALDGKTPKEAFRSAYFCGLMYFGVLLYWLVYVDPLIALFGYPALILYIALYFGVFGYCYSYFKDIGVIQRLFLLPSVWVGLEYIRTHIISGFGWGSLGESQYKVLPIIQIADMTGLLGVSFLIVMSNVCLKSLISTKKKSAGSSVITVIFVLSSVSYGLFRLNQDIPAAGSMRVGVVQANIAQNRKWDRYQWPAIFLEHTDLTEKALEQKPDLIIWSETSFPGYIGEDDFLFEKFQQFIGKWNTPTLFGSVVVDDGKYFNSAVLLSSRGLQQRYDKTHLVPFGEYFPFRSLVSWLSEIIPIADFTSGKKHTAFSLDNSSNTFSVLICFEDAFSYLAREAVLAGGDLLVNITNDAWFNDTREPFMHTASSVFRAVENRRNLIRAANTGISGFIDAKGHMYNWVRDDEKMTYVSGTAVDDVNFIEELSFYTKYGDFFTFLCFGCIITILIVNINRKKGF